MKRKLVDHLVNHGIVERNDVQRCVLRASMNEGSVIDEMTERIDVDERELAAAMAEFWGIEFWDRSFDTKKSNTEVISVEQARSFGVLPVGSDGNERIQRLAVYDVDKARPIIEKIRKKTGVSPTLVMAPRELVEQEVRRHYGVGAPTSTKGNEKPRSGTGHGVVYKKRSRSGRPSRTTRRPKKVKGATTSPGKDVAAADDAQPTRQVELGADNPFMDLVRETAPDEDATSVGADQPKTQVIGDGSDDFFADFDDDDDSDDLTGALDEFDADLDDDPAEKAEDPPMLSTSSSVNWGDFGDSTSRDPSSRALVAEASPGFDNSSVGRSESVTEESAIFPVDRDQSGFFSFPDEEEDDQLTLAEVVDRQRKIINKLEREIDYQKGILQTMAELLVEARVLSKAKLKKRLKAFKEEQRRKND